MWGTCFRRKLDSMISWGSYQALWFCEKETSLILAVLWSSCLWEWIALSSGRQYWADFTLPSYLISLLNRKRTVVGQVRCIIALAMPYFCSVVMHIDVMCSSLKTGVLFFFFLVEILWDSRLIHLQSTTACPSDNYSAAINIS